MADNVTVDNGTGTDYSVASDKVTYSGDADQAVQLVKLVGVTGAEGSKVPFDVYVDPVTAGFLGIIYTETGGPVSSADAESDGVTGADILAVAPSVWNGSGYDRVTGTTANGVDVDVTRLPALAAGTNNIGDVDVLTLPALPAGTNTIGKLAANTGVDIGDVDVTSLPALVAGSANIGDVDVLTLPADPLGANADAIVAAGATGSISAKLRRTTQGIEDLKTGIILAAGTANIGDVDVLTLPGVAGTAGHASPTSGNPVYVAGRASASIPTDVGADGDAAGMWTNRNGATVVLQAPHVGLNSDPWNLVHEAAQYTSAQTSTVLVTGAAGDKIVVTKVQIQAFATTAGTAILYFGTGAFSRGTSRAIFDGEFAPSTTLKPGVVMDGPFIAGTNGDDLMVTTTNALSITFNVWYYVIT